MLEPNAILAINSLDRYITHTITNYSSFFAHWGLAGLTQLSLDPQVPGYAPPIVGASITPGTPGIPTPNKIVALGPGYVEIQNPTDAGSGGIQEIITSNTINNAQQPTSNALEAQYNKSKPYSNNFTIQSPGAIIYGYINRIIVSQIQLQYNIPTVCLGKNDTFYLSGYGNIKIIIPHGFYYADELAATLEGLIQAESSNWQNVTVVFSPRDGFVFDSPDYTISFPTYDEIASQVAGISADLIYKTYRLLGVTVTNSTLSNIQKSSEYPIFIYTPYIDIYSDVLTNYQNIKDTNSSIQKPKGLVARIYVSGVGQNQTTNPTAALGTAPFVMTADLNTSKVINWSPDVSVPSIDFQMLDQYGDLIPGPLENFSTEFQMTLLCVEGGD